MGRLLLLRARGCNYSGKQDGLPQEAHAAEDHPTGSFSCVLLLLPPHWVLEWSGKAELHPEVRFSRLLCLSAWTSAGDTIFGRLWRPRRYSQTGRWWPSLGPVLLSLLPAWYDDPIVRLGHICHQDLQQRWTIPQSSETKWDKIISLRSFVSPPHTHNKKGS